MASNLDSLLKNFKSTEATGSNVDYENLKERGGFKEPLPPGDYLFRLPMDLERADRWAPFTSKRGERVRLTLDDLTVVQALSAKNAGYEGESRRYRITNLERNRGRQGQPEQLISDGDYFLKALGETTRPQTNQAFIKAAIGHKGEDFIGQTEFQAQCNKEKTRYIEDEQGNAVEDPTGQKGCEKRYYNDAFRLPDGSYATRLQCECGASLRAFSELTGFRRAPQKQVN